MYIVESYMSHEASTLNKWIGQSWMNSIAPLSSQKNMNIYMFFCTLWPAFTLYFIISAWEPHIYIIITVFVFVGGRPMAPTLFVWWFSTCQWKNKLKIICLFWNSQTVKGSHPFHQSKHFIHYNIWCIMMSTTLLFWKIWNPIWLWYFWNAFSNRV